MTSLKEITELMASKPTPEQMMEDDRYFGYIKSVDSVGVDVLKGITGDELATITSMIQAVGVSELMEDGDIAIKDIRFLLSDHVTKLLVIAFKLSVGIATIEEMR